jgi:hypothetical protein
MERKIFSQQPESLFVVLDQVVILVVGVWHEFLSTTDDQRLIQNQNAKLVVTLLSAAIVKERFFSLSDGGCIKLGSRFCCILHAIIPLQ